MRRRLLIALTVLLVACSAHAQDSGIVSPNPAPAVSPSAAEATDNPRITLTTSLGEIVFELDALRAPVTVANFLSYVDDGHYNGTLFHRVVPGMLIQAGGFTLDLQHKPTREPIPSEADNGLQNRRGTIAAARAPGDANSATAQFFINTVDNPGLDFSDAKNDHTRGYTVFGRVVQGLDVIDRIAAVETHGQGPFASAVPLTAIIIDRVERSKEDANPP